MEISKIIKEARIKKGMTQQQLADSVYVTRQTISKWELIEKYSRYKGR